MKQSALPKIIRILLVGMLATFAVLLVTGGFLAFFYRPNAISAWDGKAAFRRSLTVDVARSLHRLAGSLFVLAAVTLFVTVLVAVVKRVARVLAAVVALTIAAVAVPVYFIGFSLAWDQVALWAVTVGTNVRGAFLVGVDVKYVIVGSHEIQWSTYLRLAWAHTLVLPVVAVVALLVLLRINRRMTARSETTDTPTVSAVP